MAIERSRGDRVYQWCNNALLVLAIAVVLYPLIYVLSASFSSTRAVLGGRVWLWPVEPTLLGYQTIFDYALIWRGYANTVFYTFFGTIINVVLTIMAAYPLSRRDLVGRNLFMFLITFTMIFSGGLIPTYLLVRELGMIITRWVMMIPNAIAAWNVIITRTYYQATISDELLEAAQLDGCSDARFIWQIVVPLSGAITAVNTLFYAVGHWNAFFNAFIYLNDDRLFPLQIVLREILIANDIDLGIDRRRSRRRSAPGPARAAQVLADRGGQRARADDVPVRAKILRPRRHDRLHQGMIALLRAVRRGGRCVVLAGAASNVPRPASRNGLAGRGVPVERIGQSTGDRVAVPVRPFIIWSAWRIVVSASAASLELSMSMPPPNSAVFRSSPASFRSFSVPASPHHQVERSGVQVARGVEQRDAS